MNSSPKPDSLFKNITSETKATFDALLKASLLRKRNQTVSKENLILDERQSSHVVEIHEQELDESVPVIPEIRSVSPSSAKDLQNETIVEIHADVEDKAYLINKFLNNPQDDTEANDGQGETTVKAPIPRPRRRKTRESVGGSSKGTYSIAKSIDSIQSAGTYAKPDREVESNGSTEKLDNTEEIEMMRSPAQKDPPPKPRRTRITKPVIEKREIIETSLNQFSYEQIVNVKIMKTDNLELDSLVIHPVVRLYFVDVSTGSFIRKSSPNRPALFHYENDVIDYIGPILTQPYNLQQNRSMHPRWNENILINEDFNYLTQQPNHAIFFEIIDFLSAPALHQLTSNQRDSDRGWRRTAWAFLRLATPDGHSNCGRTVRLQLYRPGSARSARNQTDCVVVRWWQSGKLHKYPATLYVHVAGEKYPQNQSVEIRSRTPLQPEHTKSDVSDGNSLAMRPAANVNQDGLSNFAPIQSGLRTDRIPNALTGKLPVYDDGCFAMRFSPDGKFLACATTINKVFTIVIYELSTQDETCRFSCHHEIVYTINWSLDSRLIVTASADWTSCVLDVQNVKFLQMLPHPSFVYVSVFSSANEIATGCYDKAIRIWNYDDGDGSYNLQQELEGHNGYVTCLVFSKTGHLLISADSIGAVNIWKRKSTADGNSTWSIKRELIILEVVNLVLNEIILHPKERRAILNVRDDVFRQIDLKNGFVLQRYESPQTVLHVPKVHKMGALSACNGYLYSGTDGGEVNAWHLETGKLAAIFRRPLFKHNSAVHCVACHPTLNMLAVSQFSRSTDHVLLFSYDEQCAHPASIEYFTVSETPSMLIIDKVKNACNEKTSSRASSGNVSLREIISKMDKVMHHAE